MPRPFLIDGLQYANWSPKIFHQLQKGRVDAVHVTIAYHETFRETILNLESWNRHFERHQGLIFQGFHAEDIDLARATNRTAVFFGFQNPSPIEDDIDLLAIWQRLGVRFMQLTYNNQSLLATGCYETEDTGLTRMGRAVVAEMNRLGIVVDMSHSAEHSTLQAIEHSTRPIAITHANPHSWHPALRNKSDTVMRELAGAGGILGLSLYPHHLRGGSSCTLNDYCGMVAKAVDIMGINAVALGSDLCQDQPDSIVEWMRCGRWTKEMDYGEGSADAAGFPAQPDWFCDNRDFHNLESGLLAVGFSAGECGQIMGGNWYRFYRDNFTPQDSKT